MRKFTALIIPAAIAALALPSAPAQAQDYGPNTCLNGFVWREAFLGDVVCVPPSTRDPGQAGQRRRRVAPRPERRLRPVRLPAGLRLA